MGYDGLTRKSRHNDGGQTKSFIVNGGPLALPKNTKGSGDTLT